MMQITCFWPDAKCCRCDEPTETSEHILRCPQAEATQVWDAALVTLAKHLTSARTDKNITKAILSSLRSWRLHDDTPTTSSNPLIQAALTDQAALGWRSFLEGLPCNSWTIAQAEYATTNRPHDRFSPGSWASKLVRWVWEIPWSLWSQRNDWLHRTETVDPAIGPVDTGIQYQLDLGTVGLNSRDTTFFEKYQVTILTQRPTDRRAWLARITVARANDPDRESRRIMSAFLATTA